MQVTPKSKILRLQFAHNVYSSVKKIFAFTSAALARWDRNSLNRACG